MAYGAFANYGTFCALPPILPQLLVEQLRHAVLNYLVEDEAITEDFANRLLAWKHSGFSVDNGNTKKREAWRLRITGVISNQ